MNTEALLDLAKARQQVTDYGLAKRLGVGQSTLSNYRNGRSHPDDRLAVQLAELAGLDPAQVVAWMQVERAKDAAGRELWRGIAERLQRAGVAAVAGLVAFGGTPDAGAMAKAPGAGADIRFAETQQTDYLGGFETLPQTDIHGRFYIMSTIMAGFHQVRAAARRLVDQVHNVIRERIPTQGFPTAHLVQA